MARSTPRSLWLRSPWWDISLLAFCWVPFYLWVVFGLGLGREAFGWTRLAGAEAKSALALAIFASLAVTWVHRHYTFILVYGDSDTFARRARAYVVAPIAVFAIVIAARSLTDVSLFRAGKLDVTPWLVLLTLSGVWNVWHVVQQRYGILRVYAGKARGGLEQPTHGVRDRLLLWATVFVVAVSLLSFRQSTFAGHFNARRALRTLSPLIDGRLGTVLIAVILVGATLVTLRWLRSELHADLALRERIPRWTFLTSTILLLLVFIVHGPIVGYLCFGTAHSIEYLAFVHHFGQNKFKQRSGDTSIASVLLLRPLVFAPVLVGGLGLLYFVLQDYQRTDIYLAYYFATSLLHFLYDGWIWKVRKPEVGRPLGVANASPAADSPR